jgi:hypothetical protein
MIKVVPVEHYIISQLKEADKFVSNLSNKSLADRLEKKLVDKCCSEHPDIVSIIEVDTFQQDHWFSVSKSCCQKFESELRAFLLIEKSGNI